HHPPVPRDALLEAAALLVAEQHGGPAMPGTDTGDERGVVARKPVAVQLDEVGDEALQVVDRVRPHRVARELDELPDRQRRVVRHAYISSRCASSLRTSVRGTTMSTCPRASWKSALWNPGGRSAYVACLITRGPVKPMAAPGSAMLMSASSASDAAVPPKVGSVRMEKKADPEWWSRPTAPLTFAICIRARTPSCIRAPPEAATSTN